MRIFATAILACAALPALFADDNAASQKGCVVLACKSEAQFENVELEQVGQLQAARPDGMRVHGDGDQSATLFFSNGLAIYATDGFDFGVDTFSQMPFEPSLKDRDFEPSRSSMHMTLNSGCYGIWRTPARATSDFVLQTPLARLRIESNALALWVSQEKIAVYLADGVAYLEIPGSGFKETLQMGQYVVLQKSALSSPYPLKIERATAVEKTTADGWIERARWAYSRIHFEKDDSGKLFPRVYLPKGHFLQRSVGSPNL